jgi:hypothetical protein
MVIGTPAVEERAIEDSPCACGRESRDSCKQPHQRPRQSLVTVFGVIFVVVFASSFSVTCMPSGFPDSGGGGERGGGGGGMMSGKGGYIGGDTNFSIFSYHLPESEKDLSDVEEKEEKRRTVANSGASSSGDQSGRSAFQDLNNHNSNNNNNNNNNNKNDDDRKHGGMSTGKSGGHRHRHQEKDPGLSDTFFSNDSYPWAIGAGEGYGPDGGSLMPGEITAPPYSEGDHVGDGHENAVFPDAYEDDGDDQEAIEGGGEGEGGGAEDGAEPVDDSKDVVQQFLEEVERYEVNKEKCVTGFTHNLGKGVINQYGLNRFKAQALVAVNRANLLTRIWKDGNPAILNSEYFFYSQVRSIVESDPDIFAGGNCYDKYGFKDYYLFCAYAYRTSSEDNDINVKDLAVEYDYVAGNGSEWFATCRHNAAKVTNYTYGM